MHIASASEQYPIAPAGHAGKTSNIGLFVKEDLLLCSRFSSRMDCTPEPA
jgi:hypothetical protein